jgi:hypothetical protein
MKADMFFMCRAQSFLDLEMSPKKLVEKTKTHILCLCDRAAS